MIKELIRLVLELENSSEEDKIPSPRFRIDNSEVYVNPVFFGNGFDAVTVGDVEDKASKFPYTPSPNAYIAVKPKSSHSRVNVQLCKISNVDYAKGYAVLRKQNKSLGLFSVAQDKISCE